MEEKDDQSPRVESSTPPSDSSNDLKTSDRTLPLTQSIRLGSSVLSDSGSKDSSKPPAEEFRIDPEEEKKAEVDLNALFPGKGYDLNRLFPDEGTKKLLFELKRNKREIERFIKNLDLEEK
jgi:hypothetical protein